MTPRQPGTSPFPAVMVVDDEPTILTGSSLILRSAGIDRVITVEDARQVLPILRREAVSAVVLDLSMPHISGRILLENISLEYPHIPVVIMTATNEVETAVDCMQIGAYDYLVKPVEKDRFLRTVRKALQVGDLKREADSLKERLLTDNLHHEAAFAPIITRDKKMRGIFHYVEAVAVSPQPVLITGETGVGKELIARAIHAVQGGGEFVALNAAGLDDQMFSDALFGHTRGAFTGADTPRDGLIARAGGGVLFLDEIGDLPEQSQVKLLRLLQERRYYPLGSDAPRTSTARVVVATLRDLREAMAGGSFRRDLYYRLCAHQIHIPPLRERPGDIPPLLDHFLATAAKGLGRTPPVYPRELITLLRTYSFPGNVRELEGMVHDALARHRGGMLSLASFRKAMEAEGAIAPRAVVGAEADPWPLGASEGPLPTLKEAEAMLIEEALRRADDNQGVAARLLGISRQALNRRLSRRRKKDLER